jgi:hypothetical protein
LGHGRPDRRRCRNLPAFTLSRRTVLSSCASASASFSKRGVMSVWNLGSSLLGSSGWATALGGGQGDLGACIRSTARRVPPARSRSCGQCCRAGRGRSEPSRLSPRTPLHGSSGGHERGYRLEDGGRMAPTSSRPQIVPWGLSFAATPTAIAMFLGEAGSGGLSDDLLFAPTSMVEIANKDT